MRCILDESFLKKHVPVRKRDTSKLDYGKAFILSGSAVYTGAPYFAAMGAVKSGAGLVYLGLPKAIHGILAVKLNEPIIIPFADHDGALDSGSILQILDKEKTMSACLFGPGVGLGAHIRQIVCGLVLEGSAPLVLDADGINALKGNIDIIKRAGRPVVLTPHAGEFARIAPDFAAMPDKERAAADFAKEYGCVLVLKGSQTITALSDGDLFVNQTGNPGMAKGGSGDVLAGLITGLIAQGFAPGIAAGLATYIHGRAGDRAAQIYGEYSAAPTNLLEQIRI